ncbi:hypothetical protein ACFFIX_20325 [Metabacillus herbersteinensis]|uniref:Tyr recombinase domain-containing protein n=1 Tax=Metabacillus herbersteinensis TaxID=283816 RepID=A0ABV6GJ70_9BACI
MHLLPQIRAEGHFRWNQINRLRQAYLKACEQAKTTKIELPLEFQYDEPERVGERFYFRLWDKVSFVLKHQDQFKTQTVKAAINRTASYSYENNHYFVEFIKAERFDDNEDVESLWFLEILEIGVLGKWLQNTTEDEQIIAKRKSLYSWGYGDESLNGNPNPFDSQHKGLLTQSTFVSRHKDKAEGILLDVEPIYVAATFGLLALDICTTTGARINELLQISNTKECIRTIKVDNKLRFSLYAIPKGRDELEAFYISEQTMKLIQSVGLMLRTHYGSEKIPSTIYRGDRKHLFPKPKPYFFQYHNKAFKNHVIYSSIRFLLHGQHFETLEGKPVVVKTHLTSRFCNRSCSATKSTNRHRSKDITPKRCRRNWLLL